MIQSPERERRRCAVLGAALVAVVVHTGGCSGILDDTLEEVLPEREPLYKSSQSAPALEIPPDISSATFQDALVIPGGEAAQNEDVQPVQAGLDAQPQRVSGVLPKAAGVEIQRDGNKRWLVVAANPGVVWPRLRDFWLEQGLLIKVEKPELGIMETDWAEQRDQFRTGLIQGLVSKLSDTLYGAATRDKFRTRIERGEKPDTTEIYISHRGAEEVNTNDGTARADRENFIGKVWQPRPSDPELEAEMLNRLVVFLGVTKQPADVRVVNADNSPRATLVRGQDDAVALVLTEDFTRAWQRTSLVLDRVGFTVEDRDRSRGLFFVRYIDPEVDVRGEQSSGFLSWLIFWGDSDDDVKQQDAYLIKLVEKPPTTTHIVVLNERGEREEDRVAHRILSLLHEQLK